MYNHIFLLVEYTKELMDLAAAQHWIDNSREAVGPNQAMQLELDRRQDAIIKRKLQINDEMYDIAISN